MAIPNILGTALSGLQAAETRLGVSANNVANSTTKGYEAQAVTARSAANGGVIVDIRNGNAAALQGQDGEQASNVSLDEEAVNQVRAGYDFKANLKVIETQKELDDALLDIQA